MSRTPLRGTHLVLAAAVIGFVAVLIAGAAFPNAGGKSDAQVLPPRPAAAANPTGSAGRIRGSPQHHRDDGGPGQGPRRS